MHAASSRPESVTPFPTAIISGIGHDCPGIVAGVTGVLLAYECNIIDSTMSRLGPEFSTILIVSHPPDTQPEALQKALETSAQTQRLRWMVKPLEKPQHEAENSAAEELTYLITVSGQDRTGITHHVAQALANRRINITDLNAQQLHGEDGLVYILILEVTLSAKTDPDALEAELKTLAATLQVELSIRPIEALTF